MPSRPAPRPAVFFDRDGTLTVDSGYVYRIEDCVFIEGAIAAVKRVNDLGYFAFLVTNQSGIARGLYTEDDMHAFHAHLQQQLRAAGAHLDDIRYCPYLPGAPVAAYARESDWRKPGPGMFLDLMHAWQILAERSLVVGDRDIDMLAARAAGLAGLHFQGGNLDAFLGPHLTQFVMPK
jgi:D-glycero-D-manno-heptose 1,7-bisphosphate phosphatase